MQFRTRIVQITFICTLLGAILAVFLSRVFHRQEPLYQKTVFENSRTMQDDELTPFKGAVTPQNSQTDKVDILGFDRSTSGMAHTAQLTLISILLGAILAALFIGLPNGFAINIWSTGNLALDFRVLTIFLAAIDLWIKYSWAVIVVRWPFSLFHNFTFFLISVTMMGLALSVGYYDAWLAWGTVTCFATFLVYMFTLYTVFKGKSSSLREVVISEDPPYTQRELEELSKSSIAAALIMFLAGMILLYFTLDAYQVLS